jgi:hypothetical protein
VLDTRRLQDNVDRLLHHLLGPPQAGAGWKLQDGNEVSLVLLGDEPGWRAGEFHAGDTDQPDVDHHHDHKAARQALRQRAIGVRKFFEPAIEARKAAAQQPSGQCPSSGLMRIVRAQQQRTERRAEGERDKQRDHRRGCDGHGKLAEELPRNAGQEGGGEKHRAQRQRDGYKRAADFVHRSMGGLLGIHAGGDVALDVLHDDDCVVDDDTDCQNQAEQRQVVQRYSANQQDGERADERNRDGDHRDERGAPGLQEQENHADNEQDRHENRGHHLMNGLCHEDRRIVDDDGCDA